MENEKNDLPQVAENASDVPKKKLNGDLRTFIIALLTAVIVVLVHHGILMLCCPMANSAKNCAASQGQCPAPEFKKNRFERKDGHHPHRFHGKKFHPGDRAVKGDESIGKIPAAKSDDAVEKADVVSPTSGQDKQ